VWVIGSPAEETTAAKTRYVKAGIFDNVDFALMAHSSNQWLQSGTSLALTPLQFEFFGQTAHAASAPEMGINALDAGLITMTAINALRQHVHSDSRIHGIVRSGGTAANIVPDYCKLEFYVRSQEYAYNLELAERVKNCARAGALATGARLEIGHFEAPMANMRTNPVLNAIFCQTAQQRFGLDITAVKSGGSTDMGDVSQVCPAIHPYFDITHGDLSCAGHTRQRADYTITPFAFREMAKAADILALTAAKIMTNPALMEAVKAAF